MCVHSRSRSHYSLLITDSNFNADLSSRVAGQVRFIGSVATPWPSWTIASSVSTTLSSGPARSALDSFLSRLQDSIQAFANPTTRSDGSAASFIETEFGYKPEDVRAWFGNVRWAGEKTANPEGGEGAQSNTPSGQETDTRTVSIQTLELTLGTLQEAGVVRAPEGGWKLDRFVGQGEGPRLVA